MECASKAMGEAGYDQYGEGMSISTDPNWFDTLAAPDEPLREPKNTPEARKLVDAAKQKLQGVGKIDQQVINDVAMELEHEFALPDDVSFDIVHAAYEELKSNSLMEASRDGWQKKGLPAKKSKFMNAEAFTSLVRDMIREELKALKNKGK